MIYFIGAGSGDAKLITIKAKEILQEADVVLYTGSLVPKELMKWAKNASVIKNSHKMKYEEIFDFFKRYKDKKLLSIVSIPSPNLLAERNRDSIVENDDDFVDEEMDSFKIDTDADIKEVTFKKVSDYSGNKFQRKFSGDEGAILTYLRSDMWKKDD